MTQDRSFIVRPKLIGRVLLEADLVSPPQLDVALHDRLAYPDFRLGEILAMRGWLKSETADFFAEDWLELTRKQIRKPLGYYLQKSALLETKHIETILKEHKHTGVRFGTVAVLQGLLKSKTLDFFLTYLFPQEVNASPLLSKHQPNYNIEQQSTRENSNLKGFENIYENQENISLTESFEETEIIWID
ncbi:hypothetical protein [Myxosarcina sp. GI1]|uniref:hypothetical protein n=1 Tax=Myxosarcina sp. GI1 TaxID=1541065 RepID=UPI000563403A|nr:hypothetical protein [Myxosarcina sp. GI1]